MSISNCRLTSTSANTLQEFVTNLESILHSTGNIRIRQACCLHLVRNFTGHHFDPSNSVISSSGRSFYTMYNNALVYILSAIMYLKHIGGI